MDIKKERELFEKSSIVENYKDHMQSFSFNGNIYQYSNDLGGLSVSQMACLGLSLTVVNSMWSGWLAAKQKAVPDGFVVVESEMSWQRADELSMSEWGKVKDHALMRDYKAMIQEAQK